jgi:hypothetical protein
MKNARAAVPQMSIEKNPRKPKLARVLSRLIAAGIESLSGILCAGPFVEA